MFDSSINHPISLRVKQAVSTMILSKRAYSLKNEKGQAAVEYILILIVTLTMLSLTKDVFKTLDNFIYSYMGAYVSCLMDYGELPTQGIQEAELKKSKDGAGGGKICDSSFSDFTIGSGVSPKPGGSKGGSNSAGANTRNNTSSANNSASGNQSKVSTKSTDSLNNNGANSSPDSAGSSRYANGKIRRSSGNSGAGTADSGSEGGDDKSRILDEDELAGRGRRGDDGDRNRATTVIYERSRYKAITGKMAEEVNRKARQARAPTSRVLDKISDSGDGFGPKKNIITPPPIIAAVAEDEDNGGFQFGTYMKWIIIAGMAIAIFIFFGSQVMSFMNSQEK